MKKLIIGLFFCFVLLTVFFSSPKEKLIHHSSTQLKSAMKSKPVNDHLHPTQVHQLVLQFSGEIVMIQNDPVTAELKMRQAAMDLTESDFLPLEKMILDTDLSQDQRFVALTLLSWSKNPEAASPLVKIATHNFDPILNPNQKADFEKILRMSAVEGLSELSLQSEQKVQRLNQIISQSNLEPVVDRAFRSLWFEQKLARTTVDQDNEALKKILAPPGPL